MKNYKTYFSFLLGIFALSLFPLRALAFCPLCVVATGVLTALGRWLGVDDTIIGLWLGGFITSLAFVFNVFLIKKQKKIRLQLPLILIGFYFLTIISLYSLGDINPFNAIFGINKMVFGMIFGNILLFFGHYLDRFLRKQNQGKIFVSHQKVIIAGGLLLSFSLIFYFMM